MKKQGGKTKKGGSLFSWMLLLIAIIIYLYLFLTSPLDFSKVVNVLLSIVIRLVPVFIAIIILMGLTNYYITPKFILRHLQNSGWKVWLFATLGGILSSGPIYMWYPLLADLHNKGISYGHIACFLYNRAVKVPLLPIIIGYFGLIYAIVLTVVMILFSIIQGLVIDKLMKNTKSTSA